jgi:hypothetical protein
MGVYENFALQLTSFAIAANMTWPFVTLPLFEGYVARALEQSGARTMGVANFVRPEEREAWENYTRANLGWRQAGLDYSGLSNQTISAVPPFIWGSFRDFGPIEGPGDRGFYASMWQAAPIVTSDRICNFDAFRLPVFDCIFDGVMQNRGPTLGEVRNLDLERTKDIEFIPWPESLVGVPVFDSIEPGNKNASIVAVVNGLLPWHNLFKDLLPSDIGSIVLVVSNKCNQTFSYQIDGPDVTYLGVGDFHDLAFDETVVETDFSPFMGQMKCEDTLSLYPSYDFREDYMTQKPTTYTASVGVLFALMATVFFLYDCLVERRQSKVLNAAEASTAIVSSLFPSQVANRLMEDAEERKNLTKASKQRMGKLGSKETTSTIYDDLSRSEREGLGETDASVASKPIAELFPSATVFFADIGKFFVLLFNSSGVPARCQRVILI